MGLIESYKKGRDEKAKGYGHGSPAEYMGGHPDFIKKSQGNIRTEPEGLYYKAVFGKAFTVPYDQITKIDSDTAERLGLGRLLLVGIFAFAWKKKDKYLHIVIKDETGFENNIVFGKLNADEWRGIVSKARSSFIREKGIATPEQTN